MYVCYIDLFCGGNMVAVSPINHILLYCGYQFDHNKDPDVYNLKGDAKQSIVNQKNDQDKKIATQKYKLNDFAGDVEKSIPEIVKNKDVKQTVVQKLHERITQREDKESHWSGIHKFFHRVGHLFRGHGFNTTAERAKIVESKLSGGLVNKKDVTKFIKGELFVNLNENEQVKEHIAGLSPKQITEYVKEDVFVLDKTMIGMMSDWKQITDLWNPDQKKAFFNGVLDRPDGIKLLSEGYHNYGKWGTEDKDKIKEIDSNLNRTKFINKCLESYKTGTGGPAFPNWLTEVILLEGMNQNQWTKIQPLLSHFNLGLLANMLVSSKKPNEDLMLMTEADQQKINDNIKISTY